MARIVVLFHSDYGHTRKQAEVVLAGVASVAVGQLMPVDAEGMITDADWATLAAADAIVFGAPTYMGEAS